MIPPSFVRGRGARLWDARGRAYLDFFSGGAACGLGHADPRVARAVADQAARLVLTSHRATTPPQQDLVRALQRRTFPGGVFFSSSGAEANECAIKLARRFGAATPAGGRPRQEIVVFRGSFHGRTLATLAASGPDRARAGLGPLPGGFKAAVFGDAGSARRAVTARACAVLVEPVQGEGGVRRASPGFFRELRRLCRRRNLLLMFDEVQTGMGRTGKLFAYQDHAVAGGAVPDVLTLAKGLANGLPLAATVARPRVARLFGPGDHGSTFAGGAVACRAALAVLEAMTPRVLARVRALGRALERELSDWPEKFPVVRSVRGLGAMWGIELDRPGTGVLNMCYEQGLLIGCSAGNVLRLSPPFCLSDGELRAGLAALKRCLALQSLRPR